MDGNLPEGAYRLLNCVTGALITVLCLRLPARRAFGPQIAYALWLFVPIAAAGAVVGALAPVRVLASTVLPVQVPNISLPWSVSPADQSSFGETTWIAVGWAVGAVLVALIQWRQQHTFVRRLGTLQRTPAGTWMAESDGIGPVVVGAFHPRIVLPTGFHQRYTGREQVLVLAHESAHIRRRDPLVNLATAAAQSLLWFHPLVHLAIHYFRIDQELACDAAVLRIHPRERYRYAYALLKGQISGPVLPAGCHLDSRAAVSLKRRIVMLQMPFQSRRRRLLGAITVAMTVVAGGGVVTFFTACESETPTSTVPGRINENAQLAASDDTTGGYRFARGGHGLTYKVTGRYAGGNDDTTGGWSIRSSLTARLQGR